LKKFKVPYKSSNFWIVLVLLSLLVYSVHGLYRTRHAPFKRGLVKIESQLKQLDNMTPADYYKMRKDKLIQEQTRLKKRINQ